MASGFTVTDCFGRTVRLSAVNWERHVAQRAEIEKYHDLLPLLLSAPELVIEAAPSGHYHFYRRQFPTVQLQRVWLHAVVRYDDSDGWLATVWLAQTVRTGVQRWPKP